MKLLEKYQMDGGIELQVVHGDALKYKSEVLLLKHAGALYGLDKHVVSELEPRGLISTASLPRPWQSYIVDAAGFEGPYRLLFVGTPSIGAFDYDDVVRFAQVGLRDAGRSCPSTQTISMTLHGVGFGLDENESLRSLMLGISKAIYDQALPRALNRIAIVERDSRVAEAIANELRVTKRRHKLLDDLLKSSPSAAEPARETKRAVFVAMDFQRDYKDTYHFGIAGPVRKLGHLCERADQETFTGEIMQWVRQRIEKADLIIAEVTTANPNVYLEVGYAWGRHKPVLFLTKNPSTLRFDIQGQRSLVYESIVDLEAMLDQQLSQLLP